MNELVSVIVPVYRVEKYLERCVDSIIQQTYSNLEIILIDDGSPDLCPEICENYKNKDERISVIHQENKGPSAARNSGLNMSNGEFVIFVDSDDFLNIHIIERFMNIQRKFEAEMVVGSYEMFYGGKDCESLMKSSIKLASVTEMTSEEVIGEMLLNNNNLCVAWGKLYRKDILTNFSFPENICFGEDMFTAHILFDRAKKIVRDNSIGFFYNQEGTSLVRSEFNVKKLDMIMAAEEWEKFVNIKYPMLYEKAFFRHTVIISNICGDLADWKDDRAKGIYSEQSKWIKSNWQFISKNRYFSVKEKIKILIVKCNYIPLMRMYRKLRSIVTYTKRF